MKSLVIIFLGLTLSFVANAGDQESCANFSGFWKGQCVDSAGGVDPVMLAWEQNGCKSYQDGSEPYVIGETNIHGWKRGKLKIKRTTKLEWNLDKSKLMMKLHMTGKLPHNPLVVWELDGTGVTYLDAAGNLVIDTVGTQRVRKGLGMKSSPYNMTCNFVKVPSN